MLNFTDNRPTVLHISHITTYRYASRVDLAMHLLHLEIGRASCRERVSSPV